MKRLLVSAAAACGLLALPPSALGATIEVDTSVDEYGTNAAACSLREAVRAANDNASAGDGCAAGEAGLDVLELTAGGYALTREGIGEDLNASGDLDIDLDGGPLRIQGPPGSPATVDPATRDRALDVSGDADLELFSVRLISGDPIPDVGFTGTESGGALRWLEPAASSGLTIGDSVVFGNFAFLAGALDLRTAGEHLIEDSTITQNSAADLGAVRSTGSLTVIGTTVSANGGGGLYAEGTGPDSLTLGDSAVTGNQIGADTSPVGGALAAGDAEITNSTISDNLGGFVGGVLVEGDLEVSFSTIASNGAPDSGGTSAGGIDVASADSVTLSGTILAGNETSSGASNCNSPTAAEGPSPNLESAATCGLDGGSGSLPGTDPQLAPLASNGGSTRTRGLYPESPALDAGGACGLGADQRGVSREDGACDLGSFEGTVARPPADPPDDPAAPSKPRKCKKGFKLKKIKRKGKPSRKKCVRAKKKKKGKAKRSSAAAARPRAAAAAGGSELIGRSVEGREIRALRIGDPDAERVALVVGVIHGNERAGLRVTKRLRAMRARIGEAQIWVVDNLNPDGSREDERRNANGVDLNRNFPHNWGSGQSTASGYYPGPRAASEPETRAAMELIRKIKPDLSVWYHQPWGAVLVCGGRPKLADRYAELVNMAPSCAGRGLPGTATGWQRDRVGGTAFVVEFGDRDPSERTAARHARAVIALAEDGLAAGRNERAPVAGRAGGARASASAKLKIAKRLIPYPRSRKLDMAAYSKRHYGQHRWRLAEPKLIVIHFAVAGSVGAIYNTFARNRPDVEYGELPGVCSHYAVGAGGGAVKFVKPGIRCRHVVGLNHVALGIEHVGFSDREVLGRRAQLRGSLRLTQSLRCRFGIPVKRVIGHAESLSSRFYRELDPDFRGRTHGDFKRRSMRVYRRELRALGPC